MCISFNPIKVILSPFITKSHLNGDLSCTSESLIRRKISQLEKEGDLNKIKEKFADTYESMKQTVINQEVLELLKGFET